MTYNPGDPYVSPYLGNPYEDSAAGRASVFPYSYSTLESASKQIYLGPPHMSAHGTEYVCRTQNTFGDPPNVLSIGDYFTTVNSDQIIISLDDVLGAIDIPPSAAVPDYMPFTPAYYAIIASAVISGRRHSKDPGNACIYEYPEPHISDTELNVPGTPVPVVLTGSITLDGATVQMLEAFPEGGPTPGSPIVAPATVTAVGNPDLENTTIWGAGEYGPPRESQPSQPDSVHFDLFQTEPGGPYQTNRRCLVNPHPTYPFIPEPSGNPPGNIFGKCLFTRAQLLGKSLKASVTSSEGGPRFVENADDPDAPYSFSPPYFTFNVKLVPFAHFSDPTIIPEPAVAAVATPGGIIRLGDG